MADYSPRTWLDRVVQFPMRFTKSGETSGGVTLAADPGTVTQAGTPINAANLNQLEQGVAGSLQKSGGTMTGDIVINKSDPTVKLQAQDAGHANEQIKITNYSGELQIQDMGTSGSWVKNILRIGRSDGAATFAGIVTAPSFVTNVANAGIEHGSIATANTPFIDFHSSGNNIDWDSRIIASGGNASSGNGILNFIVSALQMNGTALAQTRTTNGYVEWYNGSIWQGVGGVKNVQRGTASIPAISPWYTDVTITAVNTSKAFVTFNNFGTGISSGTSAFRAELINSTTIRVTNSQQTGGNITVAWEVVESY